MPIRSLPGCRRSTFPRKNRTPGPLPWPPPPGPSVPGTARPAGAVGPRGFGSMPPPPEAPPRPVKKAGPARRRFPPGPPRPGSGPLRPPAGGAAVPAVAKQVEAGQPVAGAEHRRQHGGKGGGGQESVGQGTVGGAGVVQ
ncbi:MAG: hypothetical protein EOM17_06770, partial [Synergistales bacterium]|nr:hypothetical protein [Synergistales bacterium]